MRKQLPLTPGLRPLERMQREATADKQVVTYKRVGRLKTSVMATCNEKRKYGIIPEPHSGPYPVDSCRWRIPRVKSSSSPHLAHLD
jgi:hypothetical protein